jgi:hypothetical protein
MVLIFEELEDLDSEEKREKRDLKKRENEDPGLGRGCTWMNFFLKITKDYSFSMLFLYT